MRVRGRLMLAFGYVLLVVIVALEVPLAVSLRSRSLAEQRAQETTLAVATAFQARNLLGRRPTLQRQVRAQASSNEARVIVVDASGTLIADSSGPALLGTDYATADRPEIVETLGSAQVSFRVGFSDSLRQEIQAVAAPVSRIDPASGTSEVIGAVRVTQSTDQIAASVRRSVIGLVAIGLAVLAAGLLVAFVLAGSVSRPLRRLAGAAGALGSGNLEARAGDVAGPRELREVAASFDEMASRLEAMVRAQREFTANASHQLRTPLTGLKLRIESALAEAPSSAGDLRRQLAGADLEVDRLAGIVERLLLLARRVEEGAAASVVDLDDAAGRARDRFRDKADGTGSSLTARAASPASRAGLDRTPSGGGFERPRAAGPVLATASRDDVDQILDALVDNALLHAPGPVRIESGRVDDAAFLAVEDEGAGIAESELPRVAERFHRGRDAAPGGTGLGLAIVRELAERAGGQMVVARGRAGGTRVEVLLPAAGDRSEVNDP